jgi:hypothetical protein
MAICYPNAIPGAILQSAAINASCPYNCHYQNKLEHYVIACSCEGCHLKPEAWLITGAAVVIFLALALPIAWLINRYLGDKIEAALIKIKNK